MRCYKHGVPRRGPSSKPAKHAGMTAGASEVPLMAGPDDMVECRLHIHFPKAAKAATVSG